VKRRRTHPVERALRDAGRLAAGVDEVGRGPLAGPVVACAIIMPFSERAIRGVTDSKQLSPDARERLAPFILMKALSCGIGAASVREVERDNILQATIRAMRRALARLSMPPDMVLVDGRRLPTLGWEHEAIIGGDAKCYSIACASIVAKVTRDRLMRSLAARYPGSGWEHNVGYATAEHRAAIGKLGMTRHHRPSFLGLGMEARGQTVLEL
jgi:ribonuclease HII